MKKEKEEFSQIYDSYIDKIYRFIYLKVSSQDIAQDLCSETFLRGWQAFKENGREIENHQAFLYQIARNLVIDHYREKDRTRTVPVDSVPITDPAEDLEKRSFINSDLENIKVSLANLKQEYQEVITWYYVEDFTISEISQITDKSEGAVRVMIHRALKALKNKVNNNFIEEA